MAISNITGINLVLDIWNIKNITTIVIHIENKVNQRWKQFQIGNKSNNIIQSVSVKLVLATSIIVLNARYIVIYYV